MPEFDVTFSFEKTFKVEAKNQNKAKEEATDNDDEGNRLKD